MDTQTDTQTDGTDSITSTADAGGKNIVAAHPKHYSSFNVVE